jgi:hypothetical protein
MARTRALVAVLALIPALVAGPPAVAAGQEKLRVNADAALSVEFLKRIQEYMAIHNKLEATLPPRPEHATPTVLDTHARELARLIAQARSRAKQGDLLPQEVRAYLRRQIGRALAGPDGPSMRQQIMEDNPGRVQLRVNARYPEGIPVTTMPTPILESLPKLPDDIEYRFIGERLVLLDVHAQLIVDFMTDAIPH